MTKKTWLLVPPAAALAAALLVLPHLVHASDHGRAELPVEELARGARPATRNLVVDGTAAMGYSVTADQRNTDDSGHNVSTGLVDLYVPIVPDGWTPRDPVHVILKTHYWGLSELREARRHEGVARTVLWEGLDHDVRDYYAKRVGLRLAPDLMLLDGTGERGNLYWAAVGGAFLLALLFTVNAARKRRA